MILLVAMIGAIVLTLEREPEIKRQSYIKQISKRKKDNIQIVDIPSNKE